MLQKAIDALSAVFVWMGVILQVMMVLIVCYTVFTRYFLNYTPSWGEVAALLCMLWFGFLSIALGVRDDLHLSVTIVDHIFSPATLRRLEYIKYVVILGAALFMVYQGWEMVQIGSLNRVSGVGISSAWMYLEVPLAGIAMIGYCLLALGRLIRNLPAIPVDDGGAA